jgi:hypothetical protein
MMCDITCNTQHVYQTKLNKTVTPPPPFYFTTKLRFKCGTQYGLNILLSLTQNGTNILHTFTQNGQTILHLFTLPHC